jgi:hypothetical protein
MQRANFLITNFKILPLYPEINTAYLSIIDSLTAIKQTAIYMLTKEIN